MQIALEIAALLSAGLFTGAALYVAVAEHPARISLEPSAALREFRASYKRAAPMQASSAGICFLCSTALWWLTHRWGWIAGGAIVGALVPFTLLIIMPTNRLLLDLTSPPAESDAKPLLTKWARLHTVRMCLSLLGFLVLLIEAALR